MYFVSISGYLASHGGDRVFQGLRDFLELTYRFYHLKGEDLEQYQTKMRREIVAYAYSKSPFYQKLYAGRSLDDFTKLPTINKEIMMANFSTLNTVGLTKEELIGFALSMERDSNFLRYYKDRFIVGLSSGTSGNKGLVLTDRALSECLPYIFAARSGIPLGLLPFRIIFILRIHNQAFENVNSPFIHLKYVNLMTPMKQIIEEIERMRANILMAPPSMLRSLAGMKDEIHIRLKLAVSYAEVLDDEDEKLIRQGLGAPLIQLYQASEGFIGSSCKHGKLHINEDLVYLELLDEQGQPARAGMPCHRMLVTNLYNSLQPLIRYEMNDLVVLGEKFSRL